MIKSPPRVSNFSAAPAQRRPAPEGDRESERDDAEHAISFVPSATEGTEAPPFSFPGPRLPGQERAPLAVWRRASWRVLETRLTTEEKQDVVAFLKCL